MECKYLIVLVFYAFLETMLAIPLDEEESVNLVSSTDSVIVINDGSGPPPFNQMSSAAELSSTSVRTILGSDLGSTEGPEPTPAIIPTATQESSSGIPFLSSTQEQPVTNVVTPSTTGISVSTVANENELDSLETTTAGTWFSSWFGSSEGGTGTTETKTIGAESTEAGIKVAGTTDASTSEGSTSGPSSMRPDAATEVASEKIFSTTSEKATSPIVPTDSSSTPSSSMLEKTQDVAFKLSDQVRAILQHYKNPDPTGFPGAPVPDPMSIPDMDKSFGVAKMNFKTVSVYGLSKFRIDQVNTDLEKMEVYVQLHMKRLVVIGNYTLRSWFNKAAGPFSVNLHDVVAEGAAALEPDAEGHLQASDTDMDMTFRDIDLDFKNMGFAGSFFQGMVSSVGTFLFDSIKPYILNEVNTNMRRDVNEKIKQITRKLPSYVSPVDLAIMEGRKYVVQMGYDPYNLKDFEFSQSIVHINVSDLWLKGLSQFYRVGEVALSMDKNVVQIGLQLVTKELIGGCSWTVSLGRRGKLSRTGASNFTVQHLQIRAVVNQSLNIRHVPVLNDLDVEVGKVKLSMDGRGSLDYVIEIVVNQLPDLIRHIIVDALEEPIRLQVQSILDQVNLEKIVESKLPELDNLT